VSESNKENKDTSKKTAREPKKAKESRLIVSVTGISCTVCAVAIEKQVKKIEGVDDVKTAIMLNKVFIDYDPTLIDSATIRKAIDKTGYKSYMSVEEVHASR
jgi:Cu+-exporting ATPase